MTKRILLISLTVGSLGMVLLAVLYWGILLITNNPKLIPNYEKRVAMYRLSTRFPRGGRWIF